jgi:hypothetical protein
MPSIESAEWADYDGKRLFWVENGVLKAAELSEKGLVNKRVLYDFKPMKPENLKAPY